MLYFVQQFLNGAHSAALYALLAFGYALGNGVLHRANLAHGALFAFAGQTAILASVFAWNVLWLALPATVALSVSIGLLYACAAAVIVSRLVLSPLAERSPNAIVVATLAVAIVLSEAGRIAADTRDFWLPPMLATPVVLASDGRYDATLTLIQIINCAAALVCVGAGALLVRRHAFGRLWRAVADDPTAASLCGVDTRSVFHRTMLLAGAYAAASGIMAALYYGNLGFGAGLIYGLKILFVSALGSRGEPLNAAAGAALFGFAESLWAGYFPIEWRDAWMLGLLIVALVLLKSRSGTKATI